MTPAEIPSKRGYVAYPPSIPCLIKAKLPYYSIILNCIQTGKYLLTEVCDALSPSHVISYGNLKAQMKTGLDHLFDEKRREKISWSKTLAAILTVKNDLVARQ